MQRALQASEARLRARIETAICLGAALARDEAQALNSPRDLAEAAAADVLSLVLARVDEEAAARRRAAEQRWCRELVCDLADLASALAEAAAGPEVSGATRATQRAQSLSVHSGSASVVPPLARSRYAYWL